MFLSRNDISHFAVNPEVNINRSRMDLNNNIKFTGNTGRIIPFYCLEVLPGDTFEVETSLVCRLQTLIHPLMDNLFLDTYYFYVPNRLVWDNWQHFMGEPDHAWKSTSTYMVPALKIGYGVSGVSTEYETPALYLSAFKDSIADYLGCGITGDDVVQYLNVLPFRAYNKIYDDWFRDENLIDPINLYTGDDNVEWDADDPLLGGKPYYAAKLHDYFTSALPQAQRGNPVTLAANFAKGWPVQTHTTTHSPTYGIGFAPLQVEGSSGSYKYSLKSGQISGNDNYWYQRVAPYDGTFAPINLYAIPEANTSLGISINDLRMAFQVQKFMETSARYGARYIEMIYGMFGVKSPDARLQRSEYLGGHRVPITIHQIVNQTETVDAPLGNVGAMSFTTDSHQDFVHSFTEHGFILGLAVVRYKHSYSQGINKMFLRRTLYDYYFPVFANIGEQPVYNMEIYAGTGSVNNSVFGYQEAWASYRYMPDRVAGEMRPGITNTLASWHLGDYYESLPTLSESWIAEDPAIVDRAIAVTSEVADQFLFDVYVKNRATRPMPVYSIPGLVDHH